jgi:hypothetical protein
LLPLPLPLPACAWGICDPKAKVNDNRPQLI